MNIRRICILILCAQLLACGTTGPGSYSGRFGFILTCQHYAIDHSDVHYTASRATVDLHSRDSINTVEGGTVSVRGLQLQHLYDAAAGPYYLSEESDGIDPYAVCDGSWHVVRIAGSNVFPPTTDSIRASSEAIALQGLAVGDTIHRARNNMIRWNIPADTVDSVYLGIFDNAGTYMYISVPDAGSTLLTPLDLNRTVPGHAYLTISRIRRRLTSGPDGMRNEMSFESVHEMEIVIAR